MKRRTPDDVAALAELEATRCPNPACHLSNAHEGRCCVHLPMPAPTPVAYGDDEQPALWGAA